MSRFARRRAPAPARTAAAAALTTPDHSALANARRPSRPPRAAEYSDESQEEEDVDIENQYYNSKGLLETSPREALAGFQGVVQMESGSSSDGGKGEWGFKALKQVVKIRYRLNENKEMLADYRYDTRRGGAPRPRPRTPARRLTRRRPAPAPRARAGSSSRTSGRPSRGTRARR